MADMMVDGDRVESPGEQWAEAQPKEESDEPEDLSDGASVDQGGRRVGLAHVQKRRRVTRACDECRRKKIKCDGKQPCVHCTVYSYNCTYDQPSHRRRNPTPQYVESLEHKLHRAEALLRVFLPNLDFDDPGIDAVLEQHYYANSARKPGKPAPPSTSTPSVNATPSMGSPPGEQPTTDSNLDAMIAATGSMDMNEQGEWAYHGHSSGLSFLRRVKEQFKDVLGPEQMRRTASPFAAPKKSYSLGSPSRPGLLRQESSDEHSVSGIGDLPSREVAKQLCSHAIDDAGAIMICVHQPTFYKHFDRVYNRAPEEYDNEDHRFLPLLYAVMALGCLFAGDEDCDLEREGYLSLTDAGYKYFWTSRQLLDVTDCRDLTSLQAVIFMILFLQCSAKLSTCYSYIGVALRSAMRMGLHRSFRDSFTPIEAETRKRVFWVIRKMDIYVGAMLGLPQTLSEEDFDQDYPSEVDDENITEHGITPQPDGKTANICAANAAFKLTRILSKIVRYIYPIKGFKNDEHNSSREYSISYTTIRDIENDLTAWEAALPAVFKPGVDAPRPVKRIQQLLRMGFAHAQMMLYRPFLHYVSSKGRNQSLDQRAWYCAAASVGVGRNIIHITAEMKNNGLLVGSYWFMMYTTFFAILSLAFYAVENPDKAHEVMPDARVGKDTLASMAKRSMAADRCTTTLTALFEELKDLLVEQKPATAAGKSRKREAIEQIDKLHTLSDAPGLPQSGSVPRRVGALQKPDKPKQSSSSSHSKHVKRPSRSSTASVPGHANISPQTPQLGIFRPVDGINSVERNARPDVSSTPQPQSYQSNARVQHAQHQQQQQQQQPQPQVHPSQFAQSFAEQPRLQDTHYSDGGFTNFSSIIFPSADPLAYPNQPMTTLEQSYALNNQNPFSQGLDQDDMLASTPVTNSVCADDQMDVQLFGPMPWYFMNHNPYNEYSSAQALSGTTASAVTPMTGAEMWNQQARTHGLPGLYFNDTWLQTGEHGEGQ